MNSDPDWELYFYEASRINDKELVVRNLKTRSKVPANLTFASVHKENEATKVDEAQNTAPESAPHRNRPRSSPSVRLAGADVPSAKAPIRPQSSSSVRAFSASMTSLKGTQTQQSQQQPQQQTPLQSIDSVLKSETIPGWFRLDGGEHMYDFLSPSRLLGSLPDPSKSVDTHNLRNPLLKYRNSSQKIYSSSTLFASPTKSGEQTVRRSLSASVIRSGGSMSNLSVKSKEEPQKKQETPKSLGKKSPSKKSIKSPPSNRFPFKTIKPSKYPEDVEVIKRNLRQQFDTYDLNGDGTISRKEAALLLRKNVFESKCTEMDMKAALDFLLGKMDFDHDHYISYEEYERAVLEDPLLRGCFGERSFYEKV